MKKLLNWVLFGTGAAVLLLLLVLLRWAAVTDYLYHAAVKDPERRPPAGNVIVAPADGIVLYVKKVTEGVVPEVIKRGVPVPIVEHLKGEPRRPIRDGYLIGIYMSSDSVHINRAPIEGVVRERRVYNGPHMHMTQAETRIILTQLVPGWVSVKKLLGMPPYDIEERADFVLKSARETLVLEDVRDTYVYVVRIADYTVGKILTWVDEGEQLSTGQKLGMITHGSQTDLLLETTPGLEIRARPGEFVYAGETVVATY